MNTLKCLGNNRLEPKSREKEDFFSPFLRKRLKKPEKLLFRQQRKGCKLVFRSGEIKDGEALWRDFLERWVPLPPQPQEEDTDFEYETEEDIKRRQEEEKQVCAILYEVRKTTHVSVSHIRRKSRVGKTSINGFPNNNNDLRG
ncbi:hypothetical protein CHS0354_039944 [Potamilus streckersoni]|uniref:Uncharacterized protein n=1 Tax=Potamilus streckersoni TaxID=2493646 RepID=A0AAE0TGV3_9BIVA|nr:hypothetical protein CHS0354_039944 [Potamilus streckersoni]